MENPIALIEAHKRRVDKLNENVEIGSNAISLDLLRAVYRSNHLPLSTRMRAAMSALPHEVPRLAVTAMVSEQDFATVLDRRLKRIEEMKGKAIEGTPQVEVKPTLPRLADRRYRRL
jgi:hypothetical protein